MVEDLETVISKLTWGQCYNLLESIGIRVFDEQTLGELREAISENSKNGTLKPIDIRMEATS